MKNHRMLKSSSTSTRPPDLMDTHPVSCSMDAASDLISPQLMRLWMWTKEKPIENSLTWLPRTLLELTVHGESYYIKDLNTDRIYLRNRSWIKPSETSLNEIHQAKNLKVKFDENISHSLVEGKVHSTNRKASTSCLRSEDSTIKNKRAHFDSLMVIARCELISWRNANK